MLVESWGETRDGLAAIAGEIQNRGFQTVKYGFASYRGATLSGEFRELCAKYVQPSDGLLDEVANLHCAPRYLRDRGYQVMGVHGYQASFYARSTFWTRFGIDNQVFGDKFESQPTCPGPFPGVCDENLIRTSIDMLDNSAKPSFVYMLTLSSHEPLDPRALEARAKHFNEIKVVHPTQIVTRRAISALMVRLEARHGAACTLVYIVGDHQPPSASARGNIFEPGKVPYVAFKQSCPPN
jgi:phosphoglycerol transferase MdoB-like AlkP superfamily enzyme